MLCLFAFCANQYADAANCPPVKNVGVISVSSSATKDVDPNSAEMSFAVETTAKTVADATAKNKVAVSQVVDALKAKLNLQGGDTITTSQFSVQPNYNYGKDDKRTVNSYTVMNSVKIKTKEVKKVGELIDLAVAKGANRMDSLAFRLENEQNLCNDLYPEVMKKAQEQANTVAKSMNMKITGLKSAQTSSSVQYSSNVSFSSMLRANGAEMASVTNTPIEAGKIKVKAAVNAEFTAEKY